MGGPDTRADLAAWLAGCSQAEARLFEDCRRRLVEHAETHPHAWRLRGVVEADDLAHLTLVRALASGLFERFEHRGPGSLRNVLFRVLDRVVLDQVRRETALRRGGGARRRSMDDTGAPPLPADDVSPTSMARASELVALARRTLTDREFEAWRLVELAGLDSATAASCCGTTAPAVRSLVRRAKQRLVGRVRREWGEAEGRSS